MEAMLDGMETAHPLVRVAGGALVAIAVGMLAHRLLHSLLIRLTARTVTLRIMVEHTHPAGRVLLPLMLLMPVWLSAPNWEVMPYLRHLNGLLLIGVVSWLLVAMIQGIAEAIIARRPLTTTDNLTARRVFTQARVIARTLQFVVMVAGGALMLMTFPGVRAVGASLLASAGLVGIVAGLAAQPILSNMIAGLQIALSQPIRIDDVLIIEGEWGRVEEITSTYVVLNIWDSRRLIIPLQWFIQNPFQNWTRTTSALLGTVYLWVDFGTPLAPLRAEVERLCQLAPEWDGRLALLQVTDANERAMQLRALVSAADSGRAWDLRCRVREGLIDFLQRECPEALPRLRGEVAVTADGGGPPIPEPR